LQAITKQRPDNAEYTTKRRAEIKQAIHIIMSNKPLMDKIESLLGDETNESLNESEDIEEDVEKHDELNPKLFDKDRKLKPEVREKLMEIADDFKSKLEEDEIKFKLKDVKIVGSNCSYNYNKDSDLDLHLVADTKSLKCPDDLYPLLYSAYRSI
jgi:tRNA(Glu) U13 pseudouridine synthase TruD